MTWYDFVYMWQFYGALILLTLLAWGSFKFLFRKIPFFNNRNTLLMGAVIGLVLTSGIFSVGSLGTASLTRGGVSIVDIQVTTTFQTDNAGGTAVDIPENANVADLLDVRLIDANVSETAAHNEVQTGVFTVRRTGDLKATSCLVKTILPNDNYPKEAGDDGVRLSIVEKTTLGEPEVYLAGASSSGAASTSSPKGTTSIPFAEGVDIGYLGVVIEVDEEGHDGLNQYSVRDVVLDFCGSKVVTFRFHRMD